MFAIVDIAGKQFKVTKDQKIHVPKLEAKEGDVLTFNSVALLENENKVVTLGKPSIDGSSVTAKVLSHGKDDKVFVFHKNRRKGYRVQKGHREQFTQIQIENIV